MSDPLSSDPTQLYPSEEPVPDAANRDPHGSPDDAHTDTEPDVEAEGAVPPGYDWPTHGGYLGCLLGLMVSCIVGGFIGSSIAAALVHYNWTSGGAVAWVVAAIYVATIAVLCSLGWMLGKRFYRAYPQARGRTWGEHDDAPASELDEVMGTVGSPSTPSGLHGVDGSALTSPEDMGVNERVERTSGR